MSLVIYNDAENCHELMLKKLIKEADTIYIAVAFLKKSGLDKLFDIENHELQNKAIKMAVGGDFGHTEPSALRSLLDIGVDGRLMRYLGKHTVFHPKMYLFENGENRTIVIGSANLTQSGLRSNHEASIVIECRQESREWKTAICQFNKFFSSKFSTKVTKGAITEYEKFFLLQKRWNATYEPDDENLIMMDRLSLYLPGFRKEQKTDLILKVQNKEQSYDNAKKLLSELGSLKLPKEDSRFEQIINLLVGKDSYWYSTGLQRTGKPRAINNKKPYKMLISYLVVNQQAGSVPALYEKARELAPSGVGPNHITEILITLDRNRFSIMNHSSITALKYGGLADIKGDGLTYSGDDYQQFCSLCQSTKNYFGFTSMLELDSFFYYIFRSIKGA